MKRLLFITCVAVSLALDVSSAAAYPSVVWTCNGSPCTGWFRSNVNLDWDIKSGEPASPTSCVNAVIVNDTPETTRTCVLTDADGDATFTARIKLDKTAPTVTSVDPARLPDHAGWYIRPISFAVEGSDVTSGLAGCSAPGYAGPDSASAAIVATCRDVAGNVGSRTYLLSYDATPPDPGSATAITGDRVVRLSWAPGASARVMRTPGRGGAATSIVYEGSGSGFTDRAVRNRRTYRYVLTLSDQAGNSATTELAAKPEPRLLAPERRAVVTAAPLLTWTPVRGADYYNVQLFRDGRKILSAWPRRAALQLDAEWRFRGRQRRLKPGVYRWYVWPGKGRRSANRYGARIGRRSFTFAPG